jgi:hypothetical protein
MNCPCLSSVHFVSRVHFIHSKEMLRHLSQESLTQGCDKEVKTIADGAGTWTLLAHFHVVLNQFKRSDHSQRRMRPVHRVFDYHIIDLARFIFNENDMILKR